MKDTIGKSIAETRQKLFEGRVEREINGRIFPHLRGEANHGYPFSSEDEMVALHIGTGLTAQRNFDLIEDIAAKMPLAQADAFRYVAYRDLNARIEMYVKLARRHALPMRPTASAA
ncbi:MAG TPA: hypothetical protein VGM66_13925 [Candidatus Udaeobacter sp.]|jgi:hypothetical protein